MDIRVLNSSLASPSYELKIYTADWNPQNDLQAQSRCHRIGQTKNVKIYRLISRKTFEMKMFHMANLKMGLVRSN